jgi:hypothetical protein
MVPGDAMKYGGACDMVRDAGDATDAIRCCDVMLMMLAMLTSHPERIKVLKRRP